MEVVLQRAFTTRQLRQLLHHLHVHLRAAYLPNGGKQICKQVNKQVNNLLGRLVHLVHRKDHVFAGHRLQRHRILDVLLLFTPCLRVNKHVNK